MKILKTEIGVSYSAKIRGNKINLTPTTQKTKKSVSDMARGEMQSTQTTRLRDEHQHHNTRLPFDDVNNQPEQGEVPSNVQLVFQLDSC